MSSPKFSTQLFLILLNTMPVKVLHLVMTIMMMMMMIVVLPHTYTSLSDDDSICGDDFDDQDAVTHTYSPG